MLSAVKEETHFDLKASGLFFSNSTEVLFELLKTNLFQEDVNPFSERILIVPSLSLQQWIQRLLASSLSISCGFTPTFLNKGIEIITEKLAEADKKFFIPNRLELFLRIEEEIDLVSHLQEPLWEPLLSYVEGKESRKKEMIHYLTQIFERYGVYGSRAALLWEKKPQNWQQALWARIFNNWDYPGRILPTLKVKKEPLSIHLFAFSHISPLHFQFLSRAAERIPVYFYQLTPCQEFWSDLPLDHPCLIGALGKVGKELAKQVEESKQEPQEAFIVFGGNSLLKQLQRDFLKLEAHREDLGNEEDSSIQIHRFSNPHQEIIQLHNLLLSLFADGRLEPKDVIVMAPQIADYAPYIQSIFGTHVPYQITDMPLNSYAPLVKGLFQLLDLEKERWSVAAIFDLLKHPLFSSPFSITQDEIETLKGWSEMTGIRWGFNNEQRAALLKKGHCQGVAASSQTTWMEGLGFLLEELALNRQPKRIQFSQAESLGNFISLLNGLYEELKLLEIPKTLKEWAYFFKKLVSCYFKTCEETELLEAVFNKLILASRHFSEKTYSFIMAYTLLKDTLGQESITIHRNLCQAVHFCSLLPMRAIPSKLICLLGMNHDAFPRKEELQTLDLLKESPHLDYCPTRVDFDRYLFLEALLSAREKLIISYIGQDPFDLSELPPSSVVSQLLPFISPKQIFNHFSYDLSSIDIRPKPFFIKTLPLLALPVGEFVIDVTSWMRCARSPLRHYLNHQNIKIFEEKTPSIDEPLILSAAQKSTLRKEAHRKGLASAFARSEREGKLPAGMLGSYVKQMMKDECRNFTLESVSKIEIPPLQLQITPTLSCIIKGFIEPVGARGIVVAEEPSFKNCARIWPLYLLVHAAIPHLQTLTFVPSDLCKESFFEDPKPYLLEWATFYFHAKEHPFFWAPDWIEPILNADADALSKAPVYDFLLQWQLMGRKPINYRHIVETYHPLIHKLYGEMARGWF